MTQSCSEKWKPLLNNVRGKKLNWMSQYANSHSNYNSYSGIYKSSVRYNKISKIFDLNLSKSTMPTIMPIAMKVAAQTIGLDLVAVKPLSSPIVTNFYMDFNFSDKYKKNKRIAAIKKIFKNE